MTTGGEWGEASNKNTDVYIFKVKGSYALAPQHNCFPEKQFSPLYKRKQVVKITKDWSVETFHPDKYT